MTDISCLGFGWHFLEVGSVFARGVELKVLFEKVNTYVERDRVVGGDHLIKVIAADQNEHRVEALVVADELGPEHDEDHGGGVWPSNGRRYLARAGPIQHENGCYRSCHRAGVRSGEEDTAGDRLICRIPENVRIRSHRDTVVPCKFMTRLRHKNLRDQ